MLAIKTAAETASADFNIARLLDMPGGLEKIALEKLPPFIRETRDYEAFGRQILVAHNVTSEELHPIDGEDYVYYPKDMNSHACFYGADMQVPRYQIEGDGVNVAIMTITSDDTTIGLKRLLTQKYNYLERVRELSGQSVAKAEDTKILDLVERLLIGTSVDKKAPSNAAQIVTTADTSLKKTHLVNLKKTLSQHNVPLASFVMNPARLDDVLDWATSEIDQLTQREMLETGVKYSIWGNVKLITSPIIAMEVVYCFAEAEYVGRMPILKDLTVRLTETGNKLEKGLFMFEFLGIYMASQKAVGKLILDFAVGDDKIKFASGDSVMARDGSPAVGFGSLEGK
ncbi:MAG: hypothetical protein K0R00_159 [Herbinix sp.]|jgi:hypothetical protein|nr:hypothetical protein [Herbinix sp.]